MCSASSHIPAAYLAREISLDRLSQISAMGYHMSRKTARADLTAYENELVELVLDVVDKIDAAPERFQAEVDALGATRNQFVAMAVARLVVERAGEALRRDLSAFEVGIAELVVDVLDRADAAPDRIQVEAVAFGATPNQFIAVLLARFIVQKLAGSSNQST